MLSLKYSKTLKPIIELTNITRTIIVINATIIDRIITDIGEPPQNNTKYPKGNIDNKHKEVMAL